ncbi:hypothetical protein DFJ73DRAFT_926280 [Zopfochytrium polystomum]|nr:hypothetical protein DFJ73DRAFT_926280 [Zopfochytrium polystomum]
MLLIKVGVCYGFSAFATQEKQLALELAAFRERVSVWNHCEGVGGGGADDDDAAADYVATHRGHYGGWDDLSHAAFLRLRAKYGGACDNPDKLGRACVASILDVGADAAAVHAAWYDRFAAGRRRLCGGGGRRARRRWWRRAGQAAAAAAAAAHGDAMEGEGKEKEKAKETTTTTTRKSSKGSSTLRGRAAAVRAAQVPTPSAAQSARPPNAPNARGAPLRPSAPILVVGLQAFLVVGLQTNSDSVLVVHAGLIFLRDAPGVVVVEAHLHAAHIFVQALVDDWQAVVFFFVQACLHPGAFVVQAHLRSGVVFVQVRHADPVDLQAVVGPSSKPTSLPTISSYKPSTSSSYEPTTASSSHVPTPTSVPTCSRPLAGASVFDIAGEYEITSLSGSKCIPNSVYHLTPISSTSFIIDRSVNDDKFFNLGATFV